MVRANSISMDLYFLALEFTTIVDGMIRMLHGLRDGQTEQLQLAARMIPFHIAEGSGFRKEDNGIKAYACALRCSTECTSILRNCELLKDVDEVQKDRARELLLKLISMLNRILLRQDQAFRENNPPLLS